MKKPINHLRWQTGDGSVLAEHEPGKIDLYLLPNGRKFTDFGNVRWPKSGLSTWGALPVRRYKISKVDGYWTVEDHLGLAFSSTEFKFAAGFVARILGRASSEQSIDPD